MSATPAGTRVPHGLTLTADTPWIVPPDQPEPIQRALEDIKRDWYKVLGHLPVILPAPPLDWNGPLIYFGLNVHVALTGNVKPPAGRESFVLATGILSGGQSVVLATGADLRGAIYAAYAFSEEILGVDPWWFWADHEPAFRGTIAVRADLNLQFGPATFKYRGWFINDEDLLSGFSPDPLRENVFSLEILDRICETLLRLRGNMLVPATFAFPDERCHDFTARRGLILNMHHILVLGLNTYRWPTEVPYSHTRHPEIMERYWRQCIDAFKDKELVWTVGYRGKHDNAFWQNEPSIKTPADRGAAITHAIARQVSMIRQVQPAAPIIANMWDEGADLFRQGLIQLPPGVSLVWPDDGTGLIRDKHEVRPGQGIYYHTAMFMWWFNQLTEMVPPSRIFQELGRFAQAGATEYFLVNVSDLRPVPLSTECAMRLAWDIRPQLQRTDQDNQAAYLLAWCRRQFGDAAAPQVATLYREYFEIPAHRDDVRAGDNAPHSHMRKLNAEVLPFIRAGQTSPAEAHTLAAERSAQETQAAYLRDWCERQSGAAAAAGVAALYRDYFDETARRTGEGNVREGEAAGLRPSLALSAGILALAESRQEFAPLNVAALTQLLTKAKAAAAQIPPGRREFYQAHYLTAIGILLHSQRMLEAYCRSIRRWSAGDITGALVYGASALEEVEGIFAAMRLAERGKWAGWYIGECFVGLDGSRDLLRGHLATLRGEPVPPVRLRRSYEHICRYQDRFRANFPLLYGSPPATPAAAHCGV